MKLTEAERIALKLAQLDENEAIVIAAINLDVYECRFSLEERLNLIAVGQDVLKTIQELRRGLLEGYQTISEDWNAS